MDTETNYLSQCKRGERRFSLNKLVDLIEYFGITANDIISIPYAAEKRTKENNICLWEIHELLENCTDNQLAVILNTLTETMPNIKESSPAPWTRRFFA